MKERLKPLDMELVFREVKRQGFHDWLVERMISAYVVARKGKRNTCDEHKFELNWRENIENLIRSIEERNYEPGASIAFVIYDPMVREIFAAPFRDRSVHHFLYDFCAGDFDQDFIATSTSCRPTKGTLYAIKQAQRDMQEVLREGKGEARVMKLDIQGYFMSLPRERLCQMILRDVEKQFQPYRGRVEAEKLFLLVKFLWEQIILDDPIKKAVRRGNPGNWSPKKLPPRKSLYAQSPGQGIVIGNLTSQLASNEYLNRLDHFVMGELGYKHYGRYVDDFYIMVTEEDFAQLKRDVNKIDDFLKRELGLVLHPKKRYCQPVRRGMSFLGARIYPYCLYPSDRLQGKFRRAVQRFERGEESVETVISYLGHMRHLDGEKFIRKVFREVGWDSGLYLETKKEIRRPMRELVMEMAGKV